MTTSNLSTLAVPRTSLQDEAVHCAEGPEQGEPWRGCWPLCKLEADGWDANTYRAVGRV